MERGSVRALCEAMPCVTEQGVDENWLQRASPLTDHCGESRHELVQRLAYQHWQQRGCPMGSPEVDWFAAENALRSYLRASRVELGEGRNLYH